MHTMRSMSYCAISTVALLGCGDELELYGPRMDDHPVWLWTGTKEADAPTCPGDRLADYEGWSMETALETCGACTCGPAACDLPSTVTAHTSLCSNPGAGTLVPFNAGGGLIGVCTPVASPVASGAFASVTYEPPALAHACAPSQLEPPPISGQFIKACPIDAEQSRRIDFALCITPEHDGACRPEFSKRFESTRRIRDDRTCTPCTCGAPSGGDCRVDVLLYGDGTCTNQLDTGFGIGLGATTCHDASAPLSPSAVRVIFTQNEPGTCTPTTSTSEVRGSVERDEARVFCCDR